MIMDKGTALMAVFVVLGFLSTVVAPIAIFIVGERRDRKRSFRSR